MRTEDSPAPNQVLTPEPSLHGSDLPASEVAGEGDDSGPPPDAIREELQRILESVFFRTSRRGSQFLSFVVHYQLENHPEPLKERMIGVALFNRSVD